MLLTRYAKVCKQQPDNQHEMLEHLYIRHVVPVEDLPSKAFRKPTLHKHASLSSRTEIPTFQVTTRPVLCSSRENINGGNGLRQVPSPPHLFDFLDEEERSANAIQSDKSRKDKLDLAKTFIGHDSTATTTSEADGGQTFYARMIDRHTEPRNVYQPYQGQTKLPTPKPRMSAPPILLYTPRREEDEASTSRPTTRVDTGLDKGKGRAEPILPGPKARKPVAPAVIPVGGGFFAQRAGSTWRKS